MKKKHAVRPVAEYLEQMTLLSTGVAPHALETAHAPAPAFAIATAEPAVRVHLAGFVDFGIGVVEPMGGVSASINIRQKVVTLANGAGALKVRLTNVHKYYDTLTARAYKIIRGTGQYRSYRGQGHSSVTVTMLGRRMTSFSASYW